MATIEFQHAVGRVYFDGGLTEAGKIIRKSKTYRNIAENAAADSLYNALEQLADLSALTFIGAEKVETSSVMD
ncbi:DUF1659 domain-containing protein [Sporosarcina sp. BP05]|uniref:DUF1659 domain-containing protein n=1 Tax=Sporosarcina sp. BP05 TaxID=2758726 RepID=UPI0016491100|nr:DUF1659 domain-containing protein [Sporosarcina sp. BP05]